MNLTTYSLDDKAISGMGATVFEAVINDLVAFKELTPEQGARLLSTYVILYSTKGWFGRAWDALFSGPELTNMYTFTCKLARLKP